jgi:hypothetical protein
VGAALIHVECPKLIDAFHDYMNTPKMGIEFYRILSAGLTGRDLGT